MFCKNCGSEISDEAVVCPNCGVPTEKLNSAATEAQPVEKKKTNVFAIIGFVLSLVAGVFAFVQVIVYWIAIVAALVLSILGIVWATKKNANLKGLAIAGVVLSAIDIVMWVILLVVGLSLIAAVT